MRHESSKGWLFQVLFQIPREKYVLPPPLIEGNGIYLVQGVLACMFPLRGWKHAVIDFGNQVYPSPLCKQQSVIP